MVIGKSKNNKETKSVVKSSLVEVLYDRTVEWGKQYNLYTKVGKPKKSKMSSEANYFHNLIAKANFGCQEQAVRDIISRLIKEQLPAQKTGKSEISYKLGVVVVPLSGSNKSIEVGVPYIVINSNNKGLTFDSESKIPKQNVLPTKLDSFRLAEKLEIQHLITELKKSDSDNVQLIMSLAAEII